MHYKEKLFLHYTAVHTYVHTYIIYAIRVHITEYEGTNITPIRSYALMPTETKVSKACMQTYPTSLYTCVHA